VKTGYKVLFLILSINGAITISNLYNIPLISKPLSTGNTTQFTSSYNFTAIGEAWEQGSGGNLYGDVTAQVRFFINLFKDLLWGFSPLLSALGMSPGLVIIINAAWTAYMGIFLLWMIGGRDWEG